MKGSFSRALKKKSKNDFCKRGVWLDAGFPSLAKLIQDLVADVADFARAARHIGLVA